MQCDEDSGDKSFIAAYDAKTGKEAWRVARKVQVSWATPVIVRAGDRDELVTSGTEWLIAYDPADRQGALAVEGPGEQRRALARRGQRTWWC